VTLVPLHLSLKAHDHPNKKSLIEGKALSRCKFTLHKGEGLGEGSHSRPFEIWDFSMRLRPHAKISNPKGPTLGTFTCVESHDFFKKNYVFSTLSCCLKGKSPKEGSLQCLSAKCLRLCLRPLLFTSLASFWLFLHAKTHHPILFCTKNVNFQEFVLVRRLVCTFGRKCQKMSTLTLWGASRITFILYPIV
jgi:hypothetical protein